MLVIKSALGDSFFAIFLHQYIHVWNSKPLYLRICDSLKLFKGYIRNIYNFSIDLASLYLLKIVIRLFILCVDLSPTSNVMTVV